MGLNANNGQKPLLFEQENKATKRYTGFVLRQRKRPSNALRCRSGSPSARQMIGVLFYIWHRGAAILTRIVPRMTVCLLLAALFGIAQAEEKNYIEPTAKTPIWQDAKNQAELTRKIKNVLLSEDPVLPDKIRNIVTQGSADDAEQSLSHSCGNRPGD